MIATDLDSGERVQVALHASDAPPLAGPRLRRVDTARERRLRAIETKLLGPEHAAEHAAARRLARNDAHGRERSLGGPDLRGSTAAIPRAPVAEAAAAEDPAVAGRWSERFSIPSVAVHAAMLPTGKILYFTGPTTARAYLLDPVTHTTENVDPPPLPGQRAPANIFCAGQTFLPDGRVLIVGGTVERRVGLNTVFTFDPFTKRWARHPDMRHGRWYPSQVLLADGRTAILDGLDERGEPFVNQDLEIYDAASESVTVAAVRGGQGAPPTGGLYPHLFAMPSGRVLVAGPERRDSWFFEPGATGLAWDDAADLTVRRTWASGVFLPGGPDGSSRVELIGGADKDALPDSGTSTPLASSEIFDERNAGAGWISGPSLNVARAHHNTVLLPDGSRATVGGGYGILNGNRRTGDPAVHRHAELYEPATNRWRLGAVEQELRTYHSTALLLPDGRVWSAGDDVNGGTDQDTAEIYEPPYLFKGPRPTIDSVPDVIAHGSTFTVRTRDAVTRAVLVAPGAVTHSNDMSQRYVPLVVTRRTDNQDVDLVAPASPRVAPPGYYMLFVLNRDGVPSMARFVQLKVPPKPAHILSAPVNPLTHDDLTLTVQAAESGVTISSVEWDLDADGSFDDGSSNPITTSFASPGQHTVRARVTYDIGITAVSERVVTVGNRPPTATIDFSPAQPLSLEPVTFTVNAADPDGVVIAFAWDLDEDGSLDDATTSTASRPFPRKGSYVVRAEVSDELGSSAIAIATVVVRNRAPIASFEFFPQQPLPLQPVAFTSTSSDLDGTVESVQWDTNADGAYDEATGPTVTRSFAAVGVYVVAVRAVDNDGDASIAQRQVTVSNDPIPPMPSGSVESAPTGPAPALSGGAVGKPPAEPILLRRDAVAKARGALRRKYGRAYGQAARRRLSCRRRSATTFRCRYSFGRGKARRTGRVVVALEGSRVAAKVSADSSS